MWVEDPRSIPNSRCTAYVTAAGQVGKEDADVTLLCDWVLPLKRQRQPHQVHLARDAEFSVDLLQEPMNSAFVLASTMSAWPFSRPEVNDL